MDHYANGIRVDAELTNAAVTSNSSARWGCGKIGIPTQPLRALPRFNNFNLTVDKADKHCVLQQMSIQNDISWAYRV